MGNWRTFVGGALIFLSMSAHSQEQPYRSDASRKVLFFKVPVKSINQRKKTARPPFTPFSGEYMTFVAETGMSTITSTNAPVQISMPAYNLSSRLNVASPTSFVPTYTFGIEYGDTDVGFVGFNCVLFDTHYPGTSFGDSFAMELPIGRNINMSNRFVFRPTLSYVLSISNGRFFNDDINNPVQVKLRNFSHLAKARADFAYHLNSRIDVVAGVGYCVEVFSSQTYDLNESPNHIHSPSPEVIYNSPVSIKDVFNFNGFSCSIGIRVRIVKGVEGY